MLAEPVATKGYSRLPTSRGIFKAKPLSGHPAQLIQYLLYFQELVFLRVFMRISSVELTTTWEQNSHRFLTKSSTEATTGERRRNAAIACFVNPLKKAGTTPPHTEICPYNLIQILFGQALPHLPTGAPSRRPWTHRDVGTPCAARVFGPPVYF